MMKEKNINSGIEVESLKCTADGEEDLLVFRSGG